MSDAAPGLRRLLRGGAVFAVVVTCAVLIQAMACSPDVPFLIGGPGAWMTAPRDVDTQLVGVDPANPPVHVFVRRFDARPGDPATLELRALVRFEAELNGRMLADPEPEASWRAVRHIDLAPALRDGRNELRVRVANPKGPALLQATLRVGERTIAAGHDWQVTAPGRNPAPAARADDTRMHPDAYLLPEPGQVMAQHAAPLGAMLLLCIALAAWVEMAKPAWLARQKLAAAAAFALVFWLAFFALAASRLPATIGFDAPAHIHQIELIRSEARLPMPHEGFQSYQPPLYHVLTAAVTAAFGATPDGATGRVAYRLVSMLAGFACVVFAGLTARRLWPRDDTRVAVTVLFAAIMPVGVYTAAYLGGESVHAAAVSGALWVATRILTSEGTQTRDLAWLGVCLSLGLLTKFTSLALAPLVVAFVLVKMRFVDGEADARVAARGAVVALGVALAGGWFYLRNWLAYGDPVVWNLDIPGMPTWWLQPGFHTPAWLLAFGEGVRHPLYAGFHSFWDGLYSTFWADGLVAGMASAATRHGTWNESLMLVGLWLAIPAGVPLAVGGWRALRTTLAGDSPPDGRTLAVAMLLAVAGVLAASMMLISLRLPFYAQAKASYVLAGLVPVAIFGADGLVTLAQRLPAGIDRPGRVGLWAWALALLLVLAGSFLL